MSAVLYGNCTMGVVLAFHALMLCSAIAGARLVCRGSTFATRQLHLVITPSWNGAIRKRMRTTGARSLRDRPWGGIYRSCNCSRASNKSGFTRVSAPAFSTARGLTHCAATPGTSLDLRAATVARRGQKRAPTATLAGPAARHELGANKTPRAQRRRKEGCPSSSIMGPQ